MRPSNNGSRQDNKVSISDAVTKEWKMRLDEVFLDGFVDLGKYIMFDSNNNVSIVLNSKESSKFPIHLRALCVVSLTERYRWGMIL